MSSFVGFNMAHDDPVLAVAGTAFSLDWNDGNIQTVDTSAATGPITPTFSNQLIGGRYTLLVVSGVTPRAINFIGAPGPNAWLFPGATPPVFGANTTDKIEVVFDGTNFIATFSQAHA